MIRGVLLDIDGTLVLSNDAHAHAWVEAFGRYGYDVGFDTVRPLIGMGGDKLIPAAVPRLSADSKLGKAIDGYRSKLFLKKYAPSLQPAPGSRELIKKMIANGLKLMVATSAKPEELKSLLKAARIEDLLTQSTTSGDADRSKPDPDIIHAALEKLGVSPEHVIMLGDTPYDIEAAGRAGVGTIAVRSGGWDDQALTGALAIYDNAADIVKHYDTSPLSKKN